jgi:hypothetical protein
VIRLNVRALPMPADARHAVAQRRRVRREHLRRRLEVDRHETVRQRRRQRDVLGQVGLGRLQLVELRVRLASISGDADLLSVAWRDRCSSCADGLATVLADAFGWSNVNSPRSVLSSDVSSAPLNASKRSTSGDLVAGDVGEQVFESDGHGLWCSLEVEGAAAACSARAASER